MKFQTTLASPAAGMAFLQVTRGLRPGFAAWCAGLALALTACGGGGSSTSSLETAAAAGSGPVSAVELAAVGHFDRLNEVRSQAGLDPVRWNAALAQAAQAHANYLSQHQVGGHEETPGLAGFTGVSISDRVRAAGYKGLLVQETKSGGQSSTLQQGRDRMDSLLLAPLHRLQLLAPEFDEAGAGVAAQGGALVTNLGAASLRVVLRKNRLMIPFDGMNGIAASFSTGSEEGLPPTLPPLTGTPLTLSGSMFAKVSYSAVTLVDEDTGATVALIALTAPDVTSASLMFFPAQPLRPNARYSWTLTATVDGVTSTTKSRFTTGA